MSNNDIMEEKNKKLFESRLQLKPNSGLITNLVKIKSNKNKLKNKTNLYFFNNNIFSTDCSSDKRKLQSGFNNSLNKFFPRNISIEKKPKKINKNRNKNNCMNNNSSITIKDVSFFQKKNSTIKSSINPIISVNKKRITYDNSNIKNKFQNLDKKGDIRIKGSLNNKNKGQRKLNQNKFSISYIDFTHEKNKFNASKKISPLKMNNKSLKKDNSSSIKKDKDMYITFLVQKIKIIKKKKKPYLNNINLDITKRKNNKTFMGKTHGLNKSKRNFNDSNRIGSKKLARSTYRNLFLKRAINPNEKNSFTNLNYNTNVNDSSLLKNYKKISERDIKTKNMNKLLLKKNKNLPKINNDKLKIKNKTTENLFIKQSKINKAAKVTNEIKFYNKNINDNKYIDKKEEVVDDFNIKSTKTNDDFDVFSEEKEKIEESSIEEESGILSMNEIGDIIIYHNMNNINKEDDYLFQKNDYNSFLSQNNNKIISYFFDIKNEEGKTKNSFHEVQNDIYKERGNINNKFKPVNNSKDFKMLYHVNNHMKKKKY